MHGGEIVAEVLERRGVRFLFTLCGGHISPILVGAKRRGLRVVDVRDEATAVFAADAVARLTGAPGVAAVTAGPGATNTITAVKNAQLAQSPVVLLGGATGTLLVGRGALQDIDQRALFAPHVKRVLEVRRLRQLAPAVDEALRTAQRGVPGPVFVECPLDLLYDRELVRQMYLGKGAGGRGLRAWALRRVLGRHVDRLFAGAGDRLPEAPPEPEIQEPPPAQVRRAARLLARARRPLLMVGSQATLEAGAVGELAAAVDRLGIPVYLSGMARGLLGVGHRLQLRHRRREALREADAVLLAGVPCDFRLDYGRQIARRARLIAVGRDPAELRRNRRPRLAVAADPGRFLRRLAAAGGRRDSGREWLERLRGRDQERESEIAERAAEPGERVNPLALFREIDGLLPPESVLVADGGDFVGTASYVLSPRGPLAWLDPGVFGTLGVGAGFALGAKLCRPRSEVWILWGDGSCAYSLAEFDTFVRHRLPVVAVVGNDASWAQIARDQVELLGDDVGTTLRRTDYHRVAAGFGGDGILLERSEEIPEALRAARRAAAAGRPVLVNALLAGSDFRKGSISV